MLRRMTAWIVRIPVRRETAGPLGTLCGCGKVHLVMPSHGRRELRRILRARARGGASP